MKSPQTEPLLLTPREAAQLLGVGRAAVYALIAKQTIPVVTVGLRKKIPRAQLQSWVAAQSSCAPQARPRTTR
jgi:excisionase family DNA binding protein